MQNSMSTAQKRELLTLLEERDRRKKQNSLASYKPYKKQIEFHALGKTKRERMFMAGNQLGKTLSGGMEIAMHVTGIYPDWWQGIRFDDPVVVIVGSKSGQLLRDGAQRILFGRPESIGTGTIPGRLIAGEPRKAQGTPDLLDSALVKHSSGGLSRIILKTYDQGRERWQADTVNAIWLDEEPPLEIYTEAMTRTNATLGPVFVTATPLLGMSQVVMRFLTEQSDDRAVIKMTIDDVDHYTAEQKAKIIASYPEHEREARANGVPIMGSGRVFPVAESEIKCEAFQIPDHWPRIAGIDFGWDHPTAGAWLAWDRDADILYVTDCYKARELTPVLHAANFKPKGEWIPVAWPHDGLQHDKGSGEQLANQYRSAGLNMMAQRATFEDGTNGVEAGVMDMLERMQTGRFKAFSHLNEWFDEFRLYHRQDGRIVKELDDIISATRYALMCKRFAITKPKKSKGAQEFGSFW